MSEYRRFTKSDWDAFGGAEAFGDGSDPFIYEMTFEDNKDTFMCIVVDRTGIQIQLFGGEDDGEDNVWMKDATLTPTRAEGYMRKLIEYTSKYTYAPDLSYELDHPSAEVVEGFKFY